MGDTSQKKECQRSASRNPTEALVNCRPFTSTRSQSASGGVMRNFSSNGFYIEASRPYRPGTILLVRTVHYPPKNTMTADERPRSICLAEVKWMRDLSEADAVHYGMGGRYLE